MKRVLVVDDERPVVDAVELMIRRDLAEEFTVVGDASSGRDAVEKALSLAPEIILMDVWMPGISGMDAVREIRARGLPCVFILVTAYERFDIAREAMELGVLDYLLKPVARDKLAGALHAAAAFADRRFELDRREMEHREREERLRSFVEEAFLRAVMMDESGHFDAGRYRTALGIAEARAVVAAAAFLPLAGSPNPEAETRALYDAFQAAVRYKTKALPGPLLAGFAVALLPLAESEDEEKAVGAFRSVIEQAFVSELSRGILRVGYAPSCPLEQVNEAWALAFKAALRPLSSREGGLDSRGEAGSEKKTAVSLDLEEGRAFAAALADGNTARARLSLERLLEAIRERGSACASDRYGLIGLFAQACRELERRGGLGSEETGVFLDLDDIRAARGVDELSLAARLRFASISKAVRKAPRWSAPVSWAVAYIRENFSRPISLESAAEEVPLSPKRLSRIFVEETGRGFSDFLIEVRIEHAKKLLSEAGASIKQVSSDCGYTDPNYFSRLFKKVTGSTPSAFSSEIREEHDDET